MSTRCTTHFLQYGKPVAIIYRHSDGYPEGAGVDLLSFLDECAGLDDSRFGDASYLAAKYVVWLAGKFNEGPSKLEFLGVGVLMTDPGDIEFRHTVDCQVVGFAQSKRPTVKCYPVGDGTLGAQVKIPKQTTEVPVKQAKGKLR